MNHKLLKLRYYLEMISLPAFAYLVIHLTAHGIELMRKILHSEDAAKHDHEHSHLEFTTDIFNQDFIIGILLLIIFAWVWHRPDLKKLIPCSHEHCHTEARIPHLLAILALCLHFFPESVIRQALIRQSLEASHFDILIILGFGIHFLVDILVAIVISSYWNNFKFFFLSFAGISLIWLIAFFIALNLKELEFNPVFEAVLYICGGFILAMFVHKPHKPVTSCNSC